VRFAYGVLRKSQNAERKTKHESHPTPWDGFREKKQIGVRRLLALLNQ
jgi:hypothetical protein